MIISDHTSVMLCAEPEDQGFMYMRGFLDLDGHQ